MGAQNLKITCLEKIQKRNSIVLAVGILLLLATTQHAHSAIFACQSGKTTIFQDVPCPLEKKTEQRTQPTSAYPLSIHASWFQIPEQAQDRAFCDLRGCECGRAVKKHHGALIQAVVEALYLDGSWHRYETSYEDWLTTPASSSESFTAREQMLEAACEVMMSQTLLRNFASDSLKVLKQHQRTAEERGFDVLQPCLDGIEQACEYYDYTQHYLSIQTDAKALRRKRGSTLDEVTQFVNASE